LPGSGKTTTAKQLALHRRGFRLGPDEWMTALGANLWDSRMRERIESLQWSVAQDLLQIGMTVIIEWGTWARTERDALRLRARELGASVELQYLEVRSMSCGAASKLAMWRIPPSSDPTWRAGASSSRNPMTTKSGSTTHRGEPLTSSCRGPIALECRSQVRSR